ncbi:MAG TPA: hypothetical protein PKZ53_21285, partial [Acidobacteriota bacterium]|nr:hypothetical protein [Acidobacteriota bacterium]
LKDNRQKEIVPPGDEQTPWQQDSGDFEKHVAHAGTHRADQKPERHPAHREGNGKEQGERKQGHKAVDGPRNDVLTPQADRVGRRLAQLFGNRVDTPG